MNARGAYQGTIGLVLMSGLLSAACVFVYLVLPAFGVFDTALIGSTLLPADSLLNAAVLEWVYQALLSAELDVFQWTAGYPAVGTLAATENLIGWQIFYLPLREMGAGVVTAYNIVLLGSLVLSGIGAALLARRFGASAWASPVAAVVFAVGSFHLANLMHLQTMAVCWVPFAMLHLDRLLETRRLVDVFALSAYSVLAFASGMYIGVFLAIMLAVAAALSWITGRHAFRWDSAIKVIAAGVLAVVALSPLLLAYLSYSVDEGPYSEKVSDVISLSLEWTSVLRVPKFQMVWGDVLGWNREWDGQPGFPGLIASSLALLAVAAGVKQPRIRPTVVVLVAIALISYVLALGPYFQTGGSGPSRVVEWLPMPGRLWLLIPGIRWPARFFFFAWLAAAMLAALGVSYLLERVAGRVKTILALMIPLLLTLEFFPHPWLVERSLRVPSPLELSDAYPFLGRERGGGAVVELPAAGDAARRSELAARYIYGSTGHFRRTAAMVGSNVPASSDSLIAAANRLPDNAARQFLVSRGVTRIVIHSHFGDAAAAERLVREMLPHSELLFSGRESVVFGLGPLSRSEQSQQPE